MSKPKKPRIRLSLECAPAVKQEITDHGELVGERSLIGSIRVAVRRSTKLGKGGAK